MDAAVKELLRLKAEYKSLTGKDYKPSATTAKSPAGKPELSSSSDSVDLFVKVEAQGSKVRTLKIQKAGKVIFI